MRSHGGSTLPERIQQLLDQRRDPVDDPAVQAWLLQQPEQLEAFARLRSALSPRSAVRPMPHRRLYVRPLVAAALLALLALLAALAAVRAVTGAPVVASIPRPDFASTGRVVSFGTCAAVAGDDAGAATLRATWSTSTQAGTVARHEVTSVRWQAPPSATMPLCDLVVRSEENRLACPRP